ncbi:MAG: purine-nucleoside phosphorylase [Planctomycetaceae bacterium]
MSTRDFSLSDSADSVSSAVTFVNQAFSRAGLFKPSVGVILGSGLGCAADRLVNSGGMSLDYSDIPGMPRPHVVGHCGALIFGRVNDQGVVMLKGRVHWYEGRGLNDVLFGVRLLAGLRIRNLLVTNAAGGINPQFSPGDLMLIRSHLRPLLYTVPAAVPVMLSGPSSNLKALEMRKERGLWCDNLRSAALGITTSLRIHEGTYAMMPGPCYETPAEIRMLQKLGADAVGMSTVPEAVEASSLGLSVLGVSCITNCAAGLTDQTLSHSEVTATASAVSEQFSEWIWNVVGSINT